MVPAVVGSPEMTPVDVLRLSPAGSEEPGAKLQVNGAPVPTPVTWAEYEVPWVPDGKEVVEIPGAVATNQFRVCTEVR